MSATIDPELRRAVIEIVDERFRELEVRRSDFIGLKEVVERLASAQVGTEGALKELAAAQKETDQSLKELAAAQKETDQSLKELAAAQKETEKALAELAAAQTRTDQQVGRLGDNIGFGLEDIARVVAPGYLLRHHGIKMGEFDRGYLNANGHPVEIDLYAEGRRNGKKVIILGEVKSRIHPREVKKFAGVIEKLKPHLGTSVFGLMFAYWIHPAASLEAKKHHIELIASYQRRYKRQDHLEAI